MKFICDRNELLEAVNTVTKAMSGRTPISLIEGIRMIGDNGRLELFCTDLKISIKSTISADFTGNFACVMPGKLFSEVVRRLPDDSVSIELEEGNEGSYHVNIICRDSRTSLTALSAEEFPDTQEIMDANAIEIPEKDLKAMIRRTSYAVSQDNTRPIFTGELIEAEDGRLNMVALDGFKFAMRSGKVQTGENRRCVVPGRALTEVMRILGDTDSPIRLHFSGMNFMMQKDSVRVMTRLLEGEFIRYAQIIPRDFSTMVRVNVDTLREAISRAELVAQDEHINLVKLSITEDAIIVTANSEAGNVRERVACITQGNDLEIAFNIRYISETLRALETEEVVLNLSSPVKACVIKPADEEEDFLYLVLPVQM